MEKSLEHPLEASDSETVVFHAKEHEYETNLFSQNHTKTNKIDSYYFSSKGNLLGIIPGTNTIISVEGPFKNYNRLTNILYTVGGDAYYLDPKRAEPTKQPNIYDRTVKMLKSLQK